MPDLDFSIEPQDQWCWAAVAISICRFCGDQRWAKQCDLVNEIFAPIRGSDDCCQDGKSTNCNMPWALDIVLNNAKHLVQPTRGVVTFDDIDQQLTTHQKPIAIRLMLSDLVTAHFIVVIGSAQTADGTQWVRVADPSTSTDNIHTIPYSALLNNYRPGAVWDQSYFTT
jgi:hypothetical protein